jgi:hypothetical protein
MINFKAFNSASATLAGIELAHMIRKKQLKNQDLISPQFSRQCLSSQNMFLQTVLGLLFH